MYSSHSRCMRHLISKEATIVFEREEISEGIMLMVMVIVARKQLAFSQQVVSTAFGRNLIYLSLNIFFRENRPFTS